ncbi:MAG: DNA recombination protein RmuC, partial [Deltaproteobacteria bacterium]
MIEILLIVICALILVNIVLTHRARLGTGKEDLQPLLASLASIEKGLPTIDDTLRNEISRNRDETNRNSKDTRGELANSFQTLTGTNENKLAKLTETLYAKLDSFQQMPESNAKGSRDEMTKALKAFQDQFKSSVTELLLNTEQRLDKMRDVLESRLTSIQNDNNEKIERMRQTVDEKLHKTLEERLGQSFQIVSDRLELVQRGLGEMHTLAIGVGDLKKVLTNVKTRGSLGEYRLEMILEQILSPEQYQKNAVTKPGSRENV